MISSLKGRLLLVTAFVLVVCLGAMVFILDHAFQGSAKEELNKRLETDVYLLIGAAEFGENGFVFPDQLSEPKFNTGESGLYGFLFSQEGDELWRSNSSHDFTFYNNPDFLTNVKEGMRRYGKFHFLEQDYFYITSGFVWETGFQEFTSVTFVVLIDAEEFYAEVISFRNNLWQWLFVLAVVLVLLLYGVMKWGLSPLQSLSSDLKLIEEGEVESLQGNYPEEIQVLTDSLNQLIVSERKQRQRYRDVMADLAHSLKTPLAVLQSINNDKNTGSEKFGLDIAEQIQRMDQIISYQLKRAMSSGHVSLQKAVFVSPLVKKLDHALQKVYQEKAVHSVLRVSGKASFHGDEADFMEILGNVLDNAYKYCQSKVDITISQHDRRLLVEISDDGCGIDDHQKDAALTRGVRLDTLTPGQGIGLAVVVDILEGYGASIEFAESKYHGALVRILF